MARKKPRKKGTKPKNPPARRPRNSDGGPLPREEDFSTGQKGKASGLAIGFAAAILIGILIIVFRVFVLGD